MKRIFFLVCLGAVGALLLRLFLVEGIVIATDSMAPTLYVGRHLFVNKIVFRFRKPRRGEIVVFPSPVEEKDLVKRVMAVGGEQIEIRNKKVYLNGNLVQESYVKYTRPDEILQGDNLGPMEVPAGHVFLLGDNRDQSGDSRDWKDPGTGNPIFFIPIEALKGRVMGAPGS